MKVESVNKIVEIKFGSHLYGTDTAESDLDLKALYLPSVRDIILGRVKPTIVYSRNKAERERNTKEDVDVEILSLGRFLQLLMEGQTMALDFLFGWKFCGITYSTPKGEKILRTIYQNRERLLTKNVSAFIGYAKAQAAKYGIKGSRMDVLKRVKCVLEKLYVVTPNKRLNDYTQELTTLISECSDLVSLEKTPLIEITLLDGKKGDPKQPYLHVNGRFFPMQATIKFVYPIICKMYENYGNRAHKSHLAGGIDWKALSHAVRVNNEAVELLTTSNIVFPRPDRELLLSIKKGEMPYEKVAELIEQGLVTLQDANSRSTLRDVPDSAWADDFLFEVYSSVVKEQSSL